MNLPLTASFKDSDFIHSKADMGMDKNFWILHLTAFLLLLLLIFTPYSMGEYYFYFISFLSSVSSFPFFITNKGGHGLFGKFYATLATILVTKLGPETHLSIPINPANNFFFTSPNDRANPGARGFSDLAIFRWIRRVNVYIEGYDLRCAVFLSQQLCSVQLCNIQNFHTSHGLFGFWLFLFW